MPAIVPPSEDGGTVDADGSPISDGASDAPQGCQHKSVLARPRAVSTSGDGRTWSNAEDALAEDSDSASVTLLTGASDEWSRMLLVSDFGFGVPTSATIEGVTVRVRRRASDSEVEDDKIQLGPNGAASGQDLAAYEWPNSLATVAYGGPTTTWGLSLTPALVNDVTFSVGLIVKNDGPTNATAYVESISAEVFYCE